MDIYKLKPAIKSYIWGGTRLKEWGKISPKSSIAESWELSFNEDGLSMVDEINVPLKDIICKDDLGNKIKNFSNFPVLIKLIDSAENLSVQVHPTDEYASIVEHSFGKTEAWYILDSEDGCGVYIGLKRQLGRSSLRQAIDDGSILEEMNFYKVKKGETYFIPAGTIHAIGKGVTLLEIQQNSNITYRLYDYDRKDFLGHNRELHIDKGLDVVSFSKYVNQKFDFPCIARCKYFSSYYLDYTNDTILATKDSFACLTFINGSGKINNYMFKKGDSFFIPAGKKAKISSNDCQYILTRIE